MLSKLSPTKHHHLSVKHSKLEQNLSQRSPFYVVSPGQREERLSMALSPFKLLIFALMIHISLSLNVPAQVDESSLKWMTDTLEWPLSKAVYENSIDENEEEDFDEEEEGEFGRRSLFWHRMKYYISYGALSANRIPCPPRSGRSYYTHNCYKAQGPVHPYTRGCSMITRCRR